MPDINSSVPGPQQETDCSASTIHTANQDVVQAASLDELADRVRTTLLAFQEATANALAANADRLVAALNHGDALNEAQVAQARVAPGGWHRWVQDCGLKLSTCKLCQQLARHRPEIEAEMARVPGLSLRAARRLITKAPPEIEAKAPPETIKRPRYGERARIRYTLKLGEVAMAKIAGTSLDKAKELNELLVFNRGEALGELTPTVRQLVDDAAAGKVVSALAATAAAKGPPKLVLVHSRDDIGPASSDDIMLQARVDELEAALRLRGDIKIVGLESEIEELTSEVDLLSGRPNTVESARGNASAEKARLRHFEFQNIALRSQIEELKAQVLDLEDRGLRAVPLAKVVDEVEHRLPAALPKKHLAALKALRGALRGHHLGPTLNLNPIADTPVAKH